MGWRSPVVRQGSCSVRLAPLGIRSTACPPVRCNDFNEWAEYCRIQIYSHYLRDMDQNNLRDLRPDSRAFFEWAEKTHDNGTPYHIGYHLHRVEVALADLNKLINQTVKP